MSSGSAGSWALMCRLDGTSSETENVNGSVPTVNCEGVTSTAILSEPRGLARRQSIGIGPSHAEHRGRGQRGAHGIPGNLAAHGGQVLRGLVERGLVASGFMEVEQHVQHGGAAAGHGTVVDRPRPHEQVGLVRRRIEVAAPSRVVAEPPRRFDHQRSRGVEPALAARRPVEREKTLGEQRVVLEKRRDAARTNAMDAQQSAVVGSEGGKNEVRRLRCGLHVLRLSQRAAAIGETADHESVPTREDLVVHARLRAGVPHREQRGPDRVEPEQQRRLVETERRGEGLGPRRQEENTHRARFGMVRIAEVRSGVEA